MPPEELTGIDVAQLDALAKLEDDHRAIQALATKALWRRDREIEICARVMADYEARMAAIVERAQPIRERVRNDLQKLDELYRRGEEALDRARVQLQECDYRHEIGEFTTEQYEQCQHAAERAIGERQAEFEAIKALRLRYRDVLPDEPIALATATAPAGAIVDAAPPPAAPSAVEVPVPTVAAASSAPAVEPVPPAAPEPSPKPIAEAPPPPVDETASADLAHTVYRHPPSSSDFRAPAPHNGPDDPAAHQTIAVSAAMLIEDRHGLPGAHHRLAPVTTIGREQDNHIVVPVREVSRRHAQIVLTDGVYVLKDLGSPNGTFVNGERITERPLQEGDRIALANQAFIFTHPS